MSARNCYYVISIRVENGKGDAEERDKSLKC